MKTQTATDAYEAAMDSAMRLIAEIESTIVDMPAPGTDVNWSMVGTATELKSRLRYALEIIHNATH